MRKVVSREERRSSRLARERSVSSSVSQDGDNEKEETAKPTILHPSSIPLPISAASSVHTSPSHQKLKEDEKRSSKLVLAAPEPSSFPLPPSASSSVAASPPPECREQEEHKFEDLSSALVSDSSSTQTVSTKQRSEEDVSPDLFWREVNKKTLHLFKVFCN